MTRRAPELVLFLATFLAVLFPLTNTDIWWHLAAGRWMVEHGALLRADPFSFATEGRPWTNLHWLFQWGAFGLFRGGGVLGLVLFKCAVFATAALLLHRVSQAPSKVTFGRGSVAVVVIVVASTLVRPLVFMRPTVVSLLFLSLLLLFLERYVERRERWLLFAMAVLQVVWSNLQPLYPLGPITVACYVVGEGAATLLARRGFSGFVERLDPKAILMLGATVLLMAVACLATPYGWAGLIPPFELFFRIEPTSRAVFSQFVTENVAPWALEAQGIDSVWYFKWVAAASFGSFFARPRRLALARLFLLMAFLVPALMANRNVLLFTWVAVFVSLRNLLELGPWTLPKDVRARAVVPTMALGATLAAVVLDLALLRPEDARISEPAPFRVPTGSLRLLATVERPLRIFTAVRYGGSLIHALYPTHSPNIDGRLILRGASEFSDYLAITEQPERFDTYARAQHVDAVVLPTTLPSRYRELIVYLAKHDDWHLVHTDGTECLFLRAGVTDLPAIDWSLPAAVAKIEADLARRYGDRALTHNAARIHLGSLLAALGKHENAEVVLAKVPEPRARSLRARSLYLRGDVDAAELLAQESVRQGAPTTEDLNLLAIIAADRGALEHALRFLDDSLRLSPQDQEGRALLEALDRRVRARGGRNDSHEPTRPNAGEGG